MKKIILHTLLLFYFTQAKAQSAGILDADFNANGKLTFPFSQDNDFGADVKIDKNSKVIVGATSVLAGKSCFAIARLNPDGSFDNNFSGDGKELTGFGNDNVSLKKILIQPDNKIIAIGSKGSDFVLARYNTNGTLDNDFSFDGKVTTAASANFNTAALDKQGNIFLLGNKGLLDSVVVIVKYKSDGSLDQNFGTAGTKNTLIAFDIRPDFLHIDDDGKMHIAGTYTGAQGQLLFYTCFTANGDVDQNVLGTAKYRSAGFAQSAILKTAVKNPDGTFYLTALTNSGLGLVKLSSTGTVVAQFGNGGRVETLLGYKNAQVSGIAVQPDGKILLGGKAIQQNFIEAMWVARFNDNGSPDNTFGNSGVLTATFGTSVNDYVYANACTLQPDGRFVVAGTFLKNSKADVALIRVLTGITTSLSEVVKNDFWVRQNEQGDVMIATQHELDLTLYNIAGLHIANLKVEPGTQVLPLSFLSRGVYVISDGKTAVKFLK